MEPDFETDSIENIEVGNETTPETALKGVPVEEAKTFTETDCPASKLPLDGFIDNVAAFAKEGKNETTNKTTKNEHIFPIFFCRNRSIILELYQ